MIYILIGFLFIVTAIIFLGYLFSAPKYSGPVSNHFNGRKFINPGGIPAKGLRDVFKWMRNREKGKWVEITDSLNGKPPAIVNKGIHISFVNHSTFLIQVDGLNILTDPVWSTRISPVSWIGPKRMRPPGIRFEDLPLIHVVLLTHNHYDHLDVPTLKNLYHKFKPVIYTSLGITAFLKSKGIMGSIDMDWWDKKEVKTGIELVSVPAQHFSSRGMFDRDATLWCGFMLKTNEGNIYFAGDSGYNPYTFKEIGEKFQPIKVALLPIGAYKPRWFMSPIHVSPDEAVQIHLDIKSQQSIAMHFGTFPMADDAQEEPVNDLKKALADKSIPSSQFMVLNEGEGKLF